MFVPRSILTALHHSLSLSLSVATVRDALPTRWRVSWPGVRPHLYKGWGAGGDCRSRGADSAEGRSSPEDRERRSETPLCTLGARNTSQTRVGIVHFDGHVVCAPRMEQPRCSSRGNHGGKDELAPERMAPATTLASSISSLDQGCLGKRRQGPAVQRRSYDSLIRHVARLVQRHEP